MGDSVDLEKVKENFERHGFVVKDITKSGSVFILEFNYPNLHSANAMRAALALSGGEVATYYKAVEKQDSVPVVMTRERVVYNFSDEDDLRSFLMSSLSKFLKFIDYSLPEIESEKSRDRTVRLFGMNKW